MFQQEIQDCPNVITFFNFSQKFVREVILCTISSIISESLTHIGSAILEIIGIKQQDSPSSWNHSPEPSALPITAFAPLQFTEHVPQPLLLQLYAYTVDKFMGALQKVGVSKPESNRFDQPMKPPAPALYFPSSSFSICRPCKPTVPPLRMHFLSCCLWFPTEVNACLCHG